jgi:hypothetical protein
MQGYMQTAVNGRLIEINLDVVGGTGIEPVASTV